mmetsp:Transcript_21036/g.67027  ORF Transcript_21036/g.67027 Transcript_21036/m.67027 type:complete len:358 (+) Transcript_21036:1159-2232(+)
MLLRSASPLGPTQSLLGPRFRRRRPPCPTWHGKSVRGAIALGQLGDCAGAARSAAPSMPKTVLVGSGGPWAWPCYCAFANLFATFHQDGTLHILLPDDCDIETRRAVTPTQLRLASRVSVATWSEFDLLQDVSRTICVLQPDEALQWASMLCSREPRLSRVVFVVGPVLPNKGQLALDQRVVERLFEASCLNFTILSIKDLRCGGETGKLVLGLASHTRIEQPVTHGDLAAALMECVLPGARRPAWCSSDVSRACALPRVVIACYSYGTLSPNTAQFQFAPAFPRQTHKYSLPVLEKPSSRWGALQFDVARPISSYPVWHGQLETKQPFARGNLLPRSLKKANRVANHGPTARAMDY